MNSRSFRNLGIVVFALVVILVGLEFADRSPVESAGDALLPDLRARINTIEQLDIERAGAPIVTLATEGGTWTVTNRSGYPADVGRIRQALLALADARILEVKTANPDRYGALGVNDPGEEGSRGVRLTVTGSDFETRLIVGDTNQQGQRYLRLAEQAAAVLIDKDPALPDAVTDWLRPELVDLPASGMTQIGIRHGDGEMIEMTRTTDGGPEFDVLDVPEGRELSYPTVVNGIAAALSNLTLVDVRPASSPGTAPDADTVSRFETADGLRVTVRTFRSDDESGDWIAISAAADELAAGPAGDAASDSSDDSPSKAGAADDNDPAGSNAAATAASLNARLGGWQFRIDDYKLEQLTRRWDDILQPEDN